jgi:hypothetical protein
MLISSIVFYLQKLLCIIIVLVSKVLVVLVIKNPLVQVSKQVIFLLLKGFNLCSYVCDTQLLYNLVLCLRNIHVNKESKV